MQQTASATLRTVDFDRVAGMIEKASGIHLKPEKRDLLFSRLRKRLAVLGLRDLRQYWAVLDSGIEDELPELLDAVATNKTEFFREPAHFDHLAGVARAGHNGTKTPPTTLRVWSAACSTGEEAYSLAMVLQEALGDAVPFKVLGTDLSGKALRRAVEGVYSEESCARVPAALRLSHLEPSGTRGCLRIRDPLRRKVTFGRLNLVSDALPFRQPMDAIFCRNVMIYFQKGTQAALIGRLAAQLRPGGWLYTGLSESLIGIPHVLRSPGASVYQKPASCGGRP